jgi:glycine/D-amino acid oxidase-like deaminating enzyme
MRERWPALEALPEDWVGVFNAEGGVLAPDVTVPAIQRLALAAGAELRGRARVTAVRDLAAGGGGGGGGAASVRDVSEVSFELSAEAAEGGAAPGGSTASTTTAGTGGTAGKVHAKRVVVAAGPWAQQALSSWFGVTLPLDIWEVTFAWYTVKPGAPRALMAALPVWRAFGGSSRCYGFPLGQGFNERADAVKIPASGHATMDVHAAPGERSRAANPAYVAKTTRFVTKELFPTMLEAGKSGSGAAAGAEAEAEAEAEAVPAGVALEEATCPYTMTRDGNFVIDWLPRAATASATAEPRVLLLAGFSGAGFKHAPLIGKMAAEMVQASLDEASSTSDPHSPPSFPDIAQFSIDRPGLYAEADLANHFTRAGQKD